jgi:hypothetical protein
VHASGGSQSHPGAQRPAGVTAVGMRS